MGFQVQLGLRAQLGALDLQDQPELQVQQVSLVRLVQQAKLGRLEQQDQQDQKNDIDVEKRQDQDVAGHKPRGVGLVRKLSLIVVVDGQINHRKEEREDEKNRTQVMGRTIAVRLMMSWTHRTLFHKGHSKLAPLSGQ